MNKRSNNNNLQGVLDKNNVANGKYEECTQHATILVSVVEASHPDYTIHIYHSNSKTSDFGTPEEVIPGVPISVKMNYFKISITNNSSNDELKYKIDTNLMKEPHAVYVYPNTKLSLRQLRSDGKCFSINSGDVSDIKVGTGTEKQLILKNNNTFPIYIYSSKINCSSSDTTNALLVEYYFPSETIIFDNTSDINTTPLNLNNNSNISSDVKLKIVTQNNSNISLPKLENIRLSFPHAYTKTINYDENIKIKSGGYLVIRLASSFGSFTANVFFKFYQEF